MGVLAELFQPGFGEGVDLEGLLGAEGRELGLGVGKTEEGVEVGFTVGEMGQGLAAGAKEGGRRAALLQANGGLFAVAVPALRREGLHHSHHQIQLVVADRVDEGFVVAKGLRAELFFTYFASQPNQLPLLFQ